MSEENTMSETIKDIYARLNKLEGKFLGMQARHDTLLQSFDEDGRFDADHFMSRAQDNLSLAQMELAMAKEAAEMALKEYEKLFDDEDEDD